MAYGFDTPILYDGTFPTGDSTKTPVSSLTAFCTPTQYFDFCDWRPAADLCTDSDTTRLTMAQLIVCTPFLNGLLAASGEIEAAALLGGRYTAADLQLLLAAGGAQSQTLIRYTAKLAEARFIQRRPDVGGWQLTSAHHEVIGESGVLDRLAAGDRIFAFQETAEAGRLDFAINTARQIEQRDLAVVQAKRLFGRRADRSDRNRQG